MATTTSAITLAARARQLAVQALIRKHRKQYDEFHREQRVALGLPPITGGPSVNQIRQQIEKAQEKIDALNAELAKLNGG